MVAFHQGATGPDPDQPLAGQRIARVDHQVEDHVLELVRIGHGHHGLRAQLQFQLDVLADRAAQHVFQRADPRHHVEGLRVERLLACEGQHALGQGGGAMRRGRGDIDIARCLVPGAPGHGNLDHVQAGDDRCQQVVEVVRDAAGELAQRIHLLRLQQLDLGALAFCDLEGQFRGGAFQFLALLGLARVAFGGVLDQHQALARRTVRRDAPFGDPRRCTRAQGEGALPALALGQRNLQCAQRHDLVGQQRIQSARRAILTEQPHEGVVGIVVAQVGVEYRDRRVDLAENFAKACFGLAQCFFRAARAQQRAQRGQQYVRIHRVDQVGVRAGVQAGDEVPGGDRGC